MKESPAVRAVFICAHSQLTLAAHFRIPGAPDTRQRWLSHPPCATAIHRHFRAQLSPPRVRAANCGATEGLLRCSRCKNIWFCSVKCHKVRKCTTRPAAETPASAHPDTHTPRPCLLCHSRSPTGPCTAPFAVSTSSLKPLKPLSQSLVRPIWHHAQDHSVEFKPLCSLELLVTY